MEHVPHPPLLTLSKAVQTSIRRVIHEVVNWIHSGHTRTRIPRLGAAVILEGLGWCIVDMISWAAAIVAFESMSQAKPVTGLMDCCFPAVVLARHRATRHGFGADDASVGRIVALRGA